MLNYWQSGSVSFFAKEKELLVSEIESDCFSAVSAINGDFQFAAESPITNDIKILMENAGGGFCYHVSRQSNMAAHTLAKYGLVHDEDNV